MKKLFIILIIMIFLPLILHAQNFIEGDVLVKKGKTAEHCLVTIISENGDAIEVKTGPDGHFLFEELHPGNYEMNIELAGHDPVKGEITLLEGSEGCCFHVKVNLNKGSFIKEAVGQVAAEYPLPVFEEYNKQRDEFLKKFDEHFKMFDKMLEGVPVEPAFAQLIGDLHGDHFAGYIPVRHLLVEPNAPLGVINVKGVADIPDGTFVIRFNGKIDGVEFFNKKEGHVASLPIMLSDGDRDLIRKCSEEGKPVGSQVGLDNMAGHDKIKVKGEEDYLPPRDEGHMCIGYWTGKKCIGIELSW